MHCVKALLAGLVAVFVCAVQSNTGNKNSYQPAEVSWNNTITSNYPRILGFINNVFNCSHISIFKF